MSVVQVIINISLLFVIYKKNGKGEFNEPILIWKKWFYKFNHNKNDSIIVTISNNC